MNLQLKDEARLTASFIFPLSAIVQAESFHRRFFRLLQRGLRPYEVASEWTNPRGSFRVQHPSRCLVLRRYEECVCDNFPQGIANYGSFCLSPVTTGLPRSNHRWGSLFVDLHESLRNLVLLNVFN